MYLLKDQPCRLMASLVLLYSSIQSLASRPLTLLELTITSADTGRQLADMLPPEVIPGNTPLEKALNMAINAALNDEIETLPDQLQNLLLETPSPEVSKALLKPTGFTGKKRDMALQEAVQSLLEVRRNQNQFSLLEQLRNAATAEEKMRILTLIQQLSQTDTVHNP